jgi:hypothetical protein
LKGSPAGARSLLGFSLVNREGLVAVWGSKRQSQNLPQNRVVPFNRPTSAVAVSLRKEPGCHLGIEPGGACHAHKSRHHCSFGAFCRWRRLFTPLASINGRLGTTKISALRADAILKFIRSAFTVPGSLRTLPTTVFGSLRAFPIWAGFAIKPIGPCVGTESAACRANLERTQGQDDHHSGPRRSGGARGDAEHDQGLALKIVLSKNSILSFPKIPSGLDSHRKAESSHP